MCHAFNVSVAFFFLNRAWHRGSSQTGRACSLYAMLQQGLFPRSSGCMRISQYSRDISDIKHGDVGDAHSDASGAVAVTVTDVDVAAVRNALRLEMSRLGTMLTADSPEALMASALSVTDQRRVQASFVCFQWSLSSI